MLFVLEALFVGICLWGGLWCSGIALTLLLKSDPQSFRVSEVPILGIPLLAIIAMQLNFFLPLNSGVLAVVWTFLAGVAIWSAWRRRRVLSGPSRIQVLGLLIFTALFVGVILAALTRGHYYDTGLYHLQRLRWIHEWPLQLGLVNLHSRLAFSTLWPEILATFFINEKLQMAVFLLNPLTYILTFAVLWFSFFESRSETERWVSATYLVIWVFGFTQLAFFNLGSPATDLPAAALTTLAFYWTTLCLKADNSTQRKQSLFFLTCCVSLLAVLTKLSQLPVLALPLFLLWKRHKEGLALERFPLIFLGVLAGFFFVKNLLLSGCFLHPSKSTCITSLPWSPRLDSVHSDAQWIRSWARQPFLHPDEVLANWNWFSPWFRSMLRSPDFGLSAMIWLLVSASGGVFWMIFRLIRRQFFSSLFPLCVALTGIGFWFLQAPDPRFGFGFFVSCAAGIWIEVTWTRREILGWWLSSAAMRFSVGAVVLWGLANQVHFRESLTRLRPPWPQIEEKATEERKTKKGVSVWVPANGAEQCWNHPPPCTPYFDNSLGRVRWGLWQGYEVQNSLEEP